MGVDPDAVSDPSPHRCRDPLGEILEQRTRDAKAIVAVDGRAALWVVFCIGDRSFAFPGAQVVEIVAFAPIHFVPGGPPALAGVVEVRGTIWSVLRLADLLDTASGPHTRRAAILLGRAADLETGWWVDGLDDVLEVAEDAILAPPADLHGRLQGLVTGVFRHHGRAVLALDMERLLGAWRAARL